ncbi:MAG: alpha/beta hydrolase [Acidimicrobiia bacterium]|nr:alpha/beta hydrolase [Acidimicrobiia bacterium]
MQVSYQPLTVPAGDNALAAGRWGTGDTIVVASHGITANHLAWQRIGELVVERSDNSVSLAALDHRGRAGSVDVPGPFGLAAHANDVVAVLDHLGVDRPAVLTGHSMGGFVVALAAERHAERVSALVLVDGGVPFPLELPPDVDVEAVIQSVIGPALDRLDQRWPDEESYVDFFRGHPAFLPPNPWPAAAEAYVRYDAVISDDGRIRSSVNKDAVLVDGGAAIVDPESSSAVRRITVPTTMLWAPRGILDQSPGLYGAEHIAAAEAELPHLCAHQVEDTNHYSIAVGEHGATKVADAILAAVGISHD